MTEVHHGLEGDHAFESVVNLGHARSLRVGRYSAVAIRSILPPMRPPRTRGSPG